MISVRGRGHFRHKRSSAALSVAPPDSSPPRKLGDELCNQPAKPSGMKPTIANAPVATTSISKYSEDDLQQIFKTVFEAQVPALAPVLAPTPVPAPAPTPAPACIIAKASCKKLKARSLDVYREKSHIDCYNSCQQCEDYFANAGAMGSPQISFIMSFFRDRISF